MLEIRSIKQAETPEFIELLSLVFDLHSEKVKPLFYNDPFYDLDRKWAIFDRGVMSSILTTVPLHFGIGKAYGIAGVATHPSKRGMGLASTLLSEVMSKSEKVGEHFGLLFAEDKRLYEGLGFSEIDRVIKGSIISEKRHSPVKPTNIKYIRECYNNWSEKNPLILKRDDQRWKFWNYIKKPIEKHRGGYICIENNIVREALFHEPSSSWPVPIRTQWLGLDSMIETLGIPIEKKERHMYLMGKNFQDLPIMFMTDQF